MVTGDVLRLGRKDGPSFKVETAKLKVVGLEDTGDQNTKLTPAERDRLLRRRLVYAGGVIAAALVAVIYYNDWRTSQLDNQLAAMAGEASELAKKEFSEAEIDSLKAAVYIVGKRVDGTISPSLRPGLLRPTSLRPTLMWRTRRKGGNGEYVLFAPGGGKPIQLKKDVSWHPGYENFKSYRDTVGTAQFGNFNPLKLISQYDVGILTIDPNTPLPKDPNTGKPVTLDLAPQDELETLKPGDPVASVGFPTEDLAGAGVASRFRV